MRGVEREGEKGKGEDAPLGKGKREKGRRFAGKTAGAWEDASGWEKGKG